MIEESSALATGSSTYNLTFSYDRYGNMACVSGTPYAFPQAVQAIVGVAGRVAERGVRRVLVEVAHDVPVVWASPVQERRDMRVRPCVVRS
jgi:hypothetical protein